MNTKERIELAISQFFPYLSEKALDNSERSALAAKIVDEIDGELLSTLIGYIKEKEKEKREIRLFCEGGMSYAEIRKRDRVVTIALDSFEDFYDGIQHIKYLFGRNGHCGHLRPRITDEECALILEYRAAPTAAQDAMRVFLKKFKEDKQ